MTKYWIGICGQLELSVYNIIVVVYTREISRVI